MILLGMPLFAWLGITLLLALLVQGYLGMASMRGKNYFKAHKILGIVIILLALTHAILAFLFMKLGIII